MICTFIQYYLGDKIGKNMMGGACSMYGGEERCIQGFGGKPEGKRPLGRPRHKWEDNTKIIFKKWDGSISGLTYLRIE